MTFVADLAKKFANDVWNESKQQWDVYLPLRDTSDSWRWSSFDKGAPTSRDFYQKQLYQPGITLRRFILLIFVGWETKSFEYWNTAMCTQRVRVDGGHLRVHNEDTDICGQLRETNGAQVVWFHWFRNMLWQRGPCAGKQTNHQQCAPQGNKFESFKRVQTSFIYLSCLPFQTKRLLLLFTFHIFWFLFSFPKAIGFT